MFPDYMLLARNDRQTQSEWRKKMGFARLKMGFAIVSEQTRCDHIFNLQSSLLLLSLIPHLRRPTLTHIIFSNSFVPFLLEVNRS